jgi:hypothetical protein
MSDPIYNSVPNAGRAEPSIMYIKDLDTGSFRPLEKSDLGGGGGGGGSFALTVTVATGAFTVSAGSRSVGFAITGNAAATIAGALVPTGTSFSVDAPSGSTIAEITGDATGTTLLITRLA